MVFNNFISSFQLDQSVFNPFVDTLETGTASDYPEEEGDSYILAEDIPDHWSKSVTQKEQKVIISPEEAISQDVIMEEDENVQKCQLCAYRQRSLDPYDSSDSYICTVDGSQITSGRQDVYDCCYFEEATQTSEDDDSI